jgi:hypothetical protein
MDTTATAQIQATRGASTRDLANAIEMMDGLSQDGFNQIMSIASLRFCPWRLQQETATLPRLLMRWN